MQYRLTLLKTHIDPENGTLKDCFPLQTNGFQVRFQWGRSSASKKRKPLRTRGRVRLSAKLRQVTRLRQR